MFASNQPNASCNKQSLPNTKIPGFFFRKRVERIDWKRLASVDVCQVASQMDIDALQENLVSVTFCDVNSELDTRYVDTNFVKLFQLAQLLIEYLLYSQEYLTNSMDAMKLENENIRKETEILRKRLDAQTQRLTSTRKECHRRRLLLLAQQQIMDAGPQSYNRCPHCPKAFVNASFLNAHLHRRHTEIMHALHSVHDAECRIGQPPTADLISRQLQPHPVVIDPTPNVNANLEFQIRERLDEMRSSQLKDIASQLPPVTPAHLPESSPQQVGDLVDCLASPPAAWKERTYQLQEELHLERERLRDAQESSRAWQSTIIEQHRADMEAMRSMFELEMKTLREQHLETQRQLIHIQLKKGPSNFGDLEDDPMDHSTHQAAVKCTILPPSAIPFVDHEIFNSNNADHDPKLAEVVSVKPVVATAPMLELQKTNHTVTSVTSCSDLTPCGLLMETSSKPTFSPPPPQKCKPFTTPPASTPRLDDSPAAADAKSITPSNSGKPKQQRKRKAAQNGIVNDVSIQAALDDTKSHSSYGSVPLSQEMLNKGIIVEGLIVRTEDEEDADFELDRNRSIHLIPCRPAFNHGSQSPLLGKTAHEAVAESLSKLSAAGVVKQVQVVDEYSLNLDSVGQRSQADNQVSDVQPVAHSPTKTSDTIYMDQRQRAPPDSPPRTSRGALHTVLASSEVPELPMNVCNNVVPYKELFDQLRSDPTTLRRLREEVQILLNEQLVDHDIDPTSKSISTDTLNERLMTLTREREHLIRKHANFLEMRSAIAKQVDRMARIALHSKRDQEPRIRPVGSSSNASGNPSKKLHLSTTSVGTGSTQSLKGVHTLMGGVAMADDGRHRYLRRPGSPTTSSADRTMHASRVTAMRLNESLQTQSTASLFEDTLEPAIIHEPTRDLISGNDLMIEEFGLDGGRAGQAIDVDASSLRTFPDAQPVEAVVTCPNVDFTMTTTIASTVGSTLTTNLVGKNSNQMAKQYSGTTAMLPNRGNLSRKPQTIAQERAQNGEDDDDDWDSESECEELHNVADSTRKAQKTNINKHGVNFKNPSLAVEELEIDDLDNLLDDVRRNHVHKGQEGTAVLGRNFSFRTSGRFGHTNNNNNNSSTIPNDITTVPPPNPGAFRSARGVESPNAITPPRPKTSAGRSRPTFNSVKASTIDSDVKIFAPGCDSYKVLPVDAYEDDFESD